MATYFRILDPGRQFLDANGDPANGYQLFIYTAGTTTKGTTYKDNAGATAHTNPIVLESDGTIPGEELWVLTGTYKFVLATAADTDPPASGTTLSDNISPINDVGSTTVSEWTASGTTVTQTTTTAFTVVGDQTTVFHVGRRLQMTDATVLYGTITATAFSTPNTTITVLLDSGSLSSSLSAVSYGVISAINSSYAPLPARDYVHAYKTSGTGAGSANTWTAITGWTVTTDYGSDFDADNNKYVVPDTGIYIVVGFVGYSGTGISDANFHQCGIYVDTGSGFALVHAGSLYQNGATISGASCQVVATALFSAGDEIKLYQRYSASSGTPTVTSVVTKLQIARIA